MACATHSIRARGERTAVAPPPGTQRLPHTKSHTCGFAHHHLSFELFCMLMQRERRIASLLNDLSFEQLAAALDLREDSQGYVAARAEITIRQMRALLEAAQAQKAAAEAQERAADASAHSAQAVQRNANYMLASVMVALVAVFVAMLSAIG